LDESGTRVVTNFCMWVGTNEGSDCSMFFFLCFCGSQNLTFNIMVLK
jgi:hypothetical protein